MQKITIVVDNMALKDKEFGIFKKTFFLLKYGIFMLLIDNNLLLPGAKLHILNNIYRK
jgi:hypothetical protein